MDYNKLNSSFKEHYDSFNSQITVLTNFCGKMLEYAHYINVIYSVWLT